MVKGRGRELRAFAVVGTGNRQLPGWRRRMCDRLGGVRHGRHQAAAHLLHSHVRGGQEKKKGWAICPSPVQSCPD